MALEQNSTSLVATDDLLCSIIKHLSLKDRIGLAGVCRRLWAVTRYSQCGPLTLSLFPSQPLVGVDLHDFVNNSWTKAITHIIIDATNIPKTPPECTLFDHFTQLSSLFIQHSDESLNIQQYIWIINVIKQVKARLRHFKTDCDTQIDLYDRRDLTVPNHGAYVLQECPNLITLEQTLSIDSDCITTFPLPIPPTIVATNLTVLTLADGFTPQGSAEKFFQRLCNLQTVSIYQFNPTGLSALHHCPKLKSVTLGFFVHPLLEHTANEGIADLRGLSQCTDLEHIHLQLDVYSVSIEVVGLDCIPTQSLRHLHIGGGLYTTDIMWLQARKGTHAFPVLTYLDFTFHSVSNTIEDHAIESILLPPITIAPELRSLKINGGDGMLAIMNLNVFDNCIHIQNLSLSNICMPSSIPGYLPLTIKQLAIYNTNLHEQDSLPVGVWTKGLQKLVIDDPCLSIVCPQECNLPRELTICHGGIDEETASLSYLEGSSTLEILHLDSMYSILGLDALATCPNLRVLTVSNVFELNDISCLHKCKSLTHVTFHCCPNIIDFFPVQELPLLQVLKVEETMGPDIFTDDEFDDEFDDDAE